MCDAHEDMDGGVEGSGQCPHTNNTRPSITAQMPFQARPRTRPLISPWLPPSRPVQSKSRASVAKASAGPCPLNMASFVAQAQASRPAQRACSSVDITRCATRFSRGSSMGVRSMPPVGWPEEGTATAAHTSLSTAQWVMLSPVGASWPSRCSHGLPWASCDTCQASC